MAGERRKTERMAQRPRGLPKGFYVRGTTIWWTRDPITGKAASSGTDNLDRAKEEFHRRQLLHADPSNPAAQTLDWWAQELLRDKRENRSEGTVDFYEGKLGHVLRLFGATAMPSDITPANVDRYLARRRSEGAINSTLGKELTAIEQLCRVAQRRGAYPGRIEALRPVSFSVNYRPRERWLTRTELTDLLAELEPHRAAHVAFIVATGARWSESLRAQAEHVLDDRIHILGTKTEAADRWIPILTAMRPLLERSTYRLPFAAWGNVRRDLAVACRRCGIEPVTPNDLRRTTASWCAEAGVQADHTAKLLGHASVKMVLRVYGRIRPDLLGKLIDQKLFSGNPEITTGTTTFDSVGATASESNDEESPSVRGRSRTADTRIFSPESRDVVIDDFEQLRALDDGVSRLDSARFSSRTTATTTPRFPLRGYPPATLAQCGNVYFGRFVQRRPVRVSVPPGTLIRIDRVRGGAA